MKTFLAQQIAAQLQIELQVRHLVREWARRRRRLRTLLLVGEQSAGLGLATPAQQTAWQCFRRTHSPEQTAGVLLVLDLRGLSLGDFVSAWLVTGDLHAAVHLLWRRPPHGPTHDSSAAPSPFRSQHTTIHPGST